MEVSVHPSQVLDLQADMIARSSVPGWLELMKTQFTEDLLDNLTGMENRRSRYSTASDIIEQIRPTVGSARAFYVDPSMTDMITWAAAGLDGTDRFRYDEVPVERGFAYFERPLSIRDVRGKEHLIHVLLWTPFWNKHEGKEDLYPGYAFFAFNDYAAHPDEISIEVRDRGYKPDLFGRWVFIGVFTGIEQERVGPESITMTDKKREEIIASGDQPHEFTNFIRLAHAYFLLLNQTIVDAYDAEIGRAVGRRAKRMGLPARVTVIRLRRVVNDASGESEVEWQHQWIVRGHWRWQHVSEGHPLAEQHGDGFRARVWVRPHVKGPEGKPLRVTDKVYALVR